MHTVRYFASDVTKGLIRNWGINPKVMRRNREVAGIADIAVIG